MDQLDEQLRRVAEGRHHDPFSVLGRHGGGAQTVIRAYLPGADEVSIAEGQHRLLRVANSDFFEWHGDAEAVPDRYRLIWRDRDQHSKIGHDPYIYPPQIDEAALDRFARGEHRAAQDFLGSRAHSVADVGGVLFAVWAPNAERVSVVGDFNGWDGRRHPMRIRNAGVWELFIPDLSPGALYKYEIRNRDTGGVFLKADPYGRAFELRPHTASVVTSEPAFRWQDSAWLDRRKDYDWQHLPMSIYEVHLGSWQRGPEGEEANYRELAVRLVDYVQRLGFSHIELLPITEHPFDPSWGYQTTGYFAPTSRFGSPDDFRFFVDYCHRHGIGVILDWVPSHFPKDAHALARFDGTALYEHADPRQGEHLDWSTLIFNYGRNEVRCFLMSSALYWLRDFHIDGLRVDAVASMLYLDYSRNEWIPNRYGGRENLEAIDFLRELNIAAHAEAPGALIVAEESTAWPQVTRPTYVGGLGFDLKWNMGWMNDTLEYMAHEPIHRSYHHERLTFSMLYAFTENFLLPFSHDEVVHGKQSMLHKMPGDDWQKFANLRTLYTYQFTHPGKKLMFMGCEFGQRGEWDSTTTLEWRLLEYAPHQGLQRLVGDLNRLYHALPALHTDEFSWQGFEWIDCHDATQSVLSFLRRTADGDDFVAVVVNFTPVPRTDYRIGLPRAGRYAEIFNSDSEYYGGSNLGNGASKLQTDELPWMGRPCSLSVLLPPLAAIILAPQKN